MKKKIQKRRLALLMIGMFVIGQMPNSTVYAQEETIVQEDLNTVEQEQMTATGENTDLEALTATTDGFVIDGTTLTGYTGTATSITIPDGVTSIGDSAFYGCSSLTSITIPEGVTSIGASVFYGCSDLTSVIIPEGVTSIGNCAFGMCESLLSITIPDSVTNLEAWAFLACSSLTSITMSNRITSIGASTFDGCSSLTSITIPESVTGIGDSAFYGCSSLTSVAIPESVTNIGDSAFFDCSSVTSVTLQEGISSIGKNAFWGCSSLTSITIPQSVTSIGEYAFNRCYNLVSATILDGLTSIEKGLFNDCNSLASITIPESVTSIGYCAFFECNALTSIAIPESVTNIDGYAFYRCIGLTSIIIPEGVTNIGECVLCDCYSLTSITIPESATSIGKDAFGGCINLTSITIPESITSIGQYAFENCNNMTSLTIPDSVTSIGEDAFKGCNGGKVTSTTVNQETNNLNDCFIIYCNANSYAYSYAQEYSTHGIIAVTPQDTITVSIESVSLNITDIRLDLNDTIKLTATVLPDNATNKNIIWSSNNTDIVTVDSAGNITAIAEGIAIITATTEDKNETATCAVYVQPSSDTDNPQEPTTVRVESVSLNTANVSLAKDERITLTAAVLPANATNRDTTWTSNNTNTAIVDNAGNVTGIAVGTAVITVTTEDGNKTAACTVNVQAPITEQEPAIETDDTILIKSIKLNTTKLTMGKKATIQLIAAVSPENVTNSSITWTSSNEKVATVSSKGKVKAVSAGNAVITATAQDGSNVLASCKIKVSKNKSYKITYKLNKGKNAATNPTYYAKGSKLKLAKPTRKNYIFSGWYIGDKKVTSISKSTEGKITLTAKWEKVTVSKTTVKSAKNKKAGKISVTFDKVKGVKGYTIYYSTNKKLKNASTIDVSSRKKSATINELEKGTTYYVTVKAYKYDSLGNRVYGKSNKTIKVKIKK